MVKNYIDAEVLLKKLRSIGGCGAKPGTWEKGWDDAIDTIHDFVVSMLNGKDVNFTE